MFFFLFQKFRYFSDILIPYFADEITRETENENVVVKKLDLSLQKSIREFAKDVLETESRLDILIHNAATVEMRTKVTEDGLELTMATNYFGPYPLTHLLIGKYI